MKDKLLSILQAKKGQKGFTLVELLVVIAIIAILVLIVIVAINPVERIRDANRRAAEGDANQIGKVVGACITDQLRTLALGDAILACDAIGELPNYTNLAALPAGTTIAARPAACTAATCTDTCVTSSRGGQLRYFTYIGGQVTATAC